MSHIIKKVICFCLIIFFVFPMLFNIEKSNVYAIEWTYDMSLQGEGHTIDEFPETYYYNDGVREGTLYRDDSSIREEVREYLHLSYEMNSAPRYYVVGSVDIDDLFSDYRFQWWTNPDTGVYTRYTLYPTLSWGDPFDATHTAYHHGEDYRGDHQNLGWMYSNSNYYRPYQYIGNATAWYFSRTPAQPLDYYPPNDGSDLSISWVQTGIAWDGGMQDANASPWFWDLVDLYGYMNPQRFISETGRQNRYRKPVRLTYQATIQSAYANAYYFYDVPLYNTVVTYRGDVSGGAGPWIDVEHEGDIILGQDLTITIDTGDPDSPTLDTYVTYTSSADNDAITYLLYDGNHTTGERQYGTIPDLMPDTTYTVTGITEDESGNTATDVHIIATGELDWIVDIDHTEQWKENMAAWDEWNERLNFTDNRYEDLFFRGEAFVAIAQTSVPIDLDSVVCELQVYNNSIQLTTTDNMTWTGEIWENNSILWEEQQATFVFTIQIGTYIDTKTVVVDVNKDFYFVYHELD